MVGYSEGSVEIHGFKHVYLVSDPSRTSDESRPIPVDKPTISVEQPTSVPPVAVARPAAPVTKHTWEVDSYPRPTDHGPREWDIGDYNDEPMAMQFANSGPTLAFRDQPFGSNTVTVNISVTGSVDDDLFGFAVGCGPGDATNESADYLLLDWKKADESYDFPDPSVSDGGLSSQGIALSRVRGVPDADEFWQHRNLDGTPSRSGLEELQRGVSEASSGWRFDQEYKFRLELTPSNFRVLLNGELVIDAPTPRDCTSGRLAYYALSQADISFWESTGTRR